jgi:hypothetical protein
MNKARMNRSPSLVRLSATLLIALAASTSLTACFPLLLGSAVVGSSVVLIDRRTTGSQIEDEAGNYGFDRHPDHANRYERAEEFFDVCAGLWDSFEDGAFIRDKASGRYLDPSKGHILNHQGRFFRVRGPLNLPRSPQGRQLSGP